MILSIRHRQKVLWIGILLAALLVIVGCAEIQPYKAPNHREEGPQKGLFTGSQGQWVIVGPKAPLTGAEENKDGAQESDTERKAKKNPAKPAASEQQ
jgi:hypothetical protein